MNETGFSDEHIPTPLTRFWVKVWPNGRITPQFGLDGKEILWGTKSSGMVNLKFLPFTPQLATRVQKEGTFAIPSHLPVIDIPLDPSETVRVRRLNVRISGSWYLCNNCKSNFDWPEVPPLPVCPNCGTKNHWYCDEHGQIIDPIFYQRQETADRTVTEVRCPTCAEPHGLIRSADLEIVSRPVESRVKYDVQVPGVQIQFDESEITVLRSCPNQNTILKR